MNVEYLIQLLNNKLIVLKNAKILAFNNGDLPSINSLDEEILGVENTIGQLKLLLKIDTAATSAKISTTEFVTSGIEAVQNVATEEPEIQGPHANAIINSYDISAYATDSLHEQKIQTIINAIPSFNSAHDIDLYIQNFATGSPVTGDMILNTAKKYIIDIPLLLAIMQNDSAFGTLGIGSKTCNPGNIGNTGLATNSFGSWEEGVMAVGNWLNNHRVSNTPITPVAETPFTDPVAPTTETLPPTDEVAQIVDNNTTTPPITDIGTTTPPIIDTSTSTPSIIDTGTTTPPIIDTGISTPPIIDTGTTTPPIIDTGTTTPPVIDPMLDRGTSTPPIIDTGTTTPPVIDTSILRTSTTTPPIPIIEQSTSTTTDSSGTVSLSKRIRRLRV